MDHDQAIIEAVKVRADRVVLDSSPWAERGAQAQLQLAVTAAEAGDEAAFAERSRALLESLDDGDARVAANIHLALGRGAMLLENGDTARSHLRQAMTTARKGGLGDAGIVAEDLLSGLERLADSALRADAVIPSPGVRIFGRHVESLGREPATSP
jgi:hypothetical protein